MTPISNSRYHLLSFLSGVVWAGLALGIAKAFDIFVPWGGIAMSPAIGILVGALSRPVFKRSTAVRIGFSIATLYIATILFGLCTGLFAEPLDESWLINLRTWSLVFPGLVTLTPVLWLLFPVAIANHFWLGDQYLGNKRSVSAAV